jgi:hypothetical protein
LTNKSKIYFKNLKCENPPITACLTKTYVSATHSENLKILDLTGGKKYQIHVCEFRSSGLTLGIFPSLMIIGNGNHFLGKII